MIVRFFHSFAWLTCPIHSAQITRLFVMVLVVSFFSSCSILTGMSAGLAEEEVGRSAGKQLGKTMKKILRIDGQAGKKCPIYRKLVTRKKSCYGFFKCDKKVWRCVDSCTKDYVRCPDSLKE